MLHRYYDFADHNLAERRRDRPQFFDLQTGHGQGMGQRLGGQGRVTKTAQPGFRELHRGSVNLVHQIYRESPIGSGKLGQKAHIALKKYAQIIHAVAQHRQAVDARAEGKSDVALRVQSHIAYHLRVHLARTGYL